MKLPTFERPPVTEVVLAVQFRPLRNLRVAQLGAFCSSLGPEWTGFGESAAIGQTTEPVGTEPSWLEPGGGVLRFDREIRLLAHRADRERLVQVENGWFVYNWRKSSDHSSYARYQRIRVEFDDLFLRFREYAKAHSLGEIEPNLWEVGYVNFIAKGTVWEHARDWPSVFPSLFAPRAAEELQLQTQEGRWAFRMPDGIGRLQVSAEHGRTSPEGKDELLVLRLTARGPVVDATVRSAGAGLDQGHEAIVRSFTAFSSERARRYWGYQP